MKRGKIVVSKDGPYLVTGGLPLRKETSRLGSSGDPEKWVKGRPYPDREKYSLCRCGESQKQPFCDGMHACVGFDGTETASRKSYARQARKTKGPGLDLGDAESLCSSARFCFPNGGTWRLTQESDDPRKRRIAVEQAGNCPSGRLVAYDKKSGKTIEPTYRPLIALIEDPQEKSSGPIWVKGGVAIESGSGRLYEARNRVTLCRCGRSKNRPFCDSSHVRVGFSDGDRSVKAARARARRSHV